MPKGYEHPKDNCTGRYIPQYEGFFLEELDKYIALYEEWKKKGADKSTFEDEVGYAPRLDLYIDVSEDDRSWVQLYENVSEGTPITPPFKTEKELVDYLVENGDFWGYQWSRASAENIVEKVWALSGVVSGGTLYRPNELGEIDKKEHT